MLVSCVKESFKSWHLLQFLVCHKCKANYQPHWLDDGKEFSPHFEELRGTVGFCPQKDMLEDENTIEENLRFIAEIKDVDPSLIEKEIDDIINKVRRLRIDCQLNTYNQFISIYNSFQLHFS